VLSVIALAIDEASCGKGVGRHIRSPHTLEHPCAAVARLAESRIDRAVWTCTTSSQHVGICATPTTPTFSSAGRRTMRSGSGRSAGERSAEPQA
jgi:hypothetical protein